jgi:hypothetical protein
MSIRKTLTMKCDGGDMPEGGSYPQDETFCEKTFTHDGAQDPASTRKAAKAAGWAADANWHFCPEHKHMAS